MLSHPVASRAATIMLRTRHLSQQVVAFFPRPGDLRDLLLLLLLLLVVVVVVVLLFLLLMFLSLLKFKF